MKLVLLFAAAGLAALLHDLDTPQVLARNLQLPPQSADHFPRLSSRSYNPNASQSPRSPTPPKPRGVMSKLRSCIGSLCGGLSTTDDRSTRGPGYTRRTSRNASPERAGLQLVPFHHANSIPEIANTQTQPPPLTPAVQRGTTSRLPESSPDSSSHSSRSRPANPAPGSEMQRQAVTSRRGSLDTSWLQHAATRGSGSSGSDPMPVAVIPRIVAEMGHASPSTWFRGPYAPLIRANEGTHRTIINLPSRSNSDESIDRWL